MLGSLGALTVEEARGIHLRANLRFQLRRWVGGESRLHYYEARGMRPQNRHPKLAGGAKVEGLDRWSLTTEPRL